MTTSTSIHPSDLPDVVPADVSLDVRLIVNDPAGAVGPDLRDAIVRHKPILAEAVARSLQLGLGPDGWRRVLVLDRQGFDWAHGRQVDAATLLRTTEGGRHP